MNEPHERVVRESELQGVWSAYLGGPAAISHRPDPIMIVAAPSLVVELVCQIAGLTVELVGHVATSGANPAVFEPMDCKRRAIGKHEVFAASSIQKPKCSSTLDEVLPLAVSTMTTFFVRQFR